MPRGHARAPRPTAACGRFGGPVAAWPCVGPYPWAFLRSQAPQEIRGTGVPRRDAPGAAHPAMPLRPGQKLPMPTTVKAGPQGRHPVFPAGYAGACLFLLQRARGDSKCRVLSFRRVRCAGPPLPERLAPSPVWTSRWTGQSATAGPAQHQPPCGRPQWSATFRQWRSPAPPCACAQGLAQWLHSGWRTTGSRIEDKAAHPAAGGLPADS